MRLIGSLPDEALARRFVDYLLTQGIEMTAEEASTGWALWVHSDDQVEEARSKLEAFVSNPADPRFGGAAVEAQRMRAQRENRERRLRERFVDVRTSWAQAAPRPRPLTMALLVVSVVVGLATEFGHSGRAWELLSIAIPVLLPDGTLRPGLPEVASGQVWRLITPIFIHMGILHLLFNMFWLYDLGSAIEARRGTGRFALLVLAAAALPNLLQFYWNGPLFGGMSGVVYALFGYIWMKQRYQPELGLGLAESTVWIMLAWLFIAPLAGPTANAAHVGGLLVGMAVGIAPRLGRILRK